MESSQQAHRGSDWQVVPSGAIDYTRPKGRPSGSDSNNANLKARAFSDPISAAARRPGPLGRT
jgi:hypothetical protein